MTKNFEVRCFRNYSYDFGWTGPWSIVVEETEIPATFKPDYVFENKHGGSEEVVFLVRGSKKRCRKKVKDILLRWYPESEF